ncbi:hypothetical protein [Neorhizobium sp. LjRoot104]|uniref:hypothetical protein n=1 Tax=Neorhizobium sp. LjRoot104 TaxID=3342254 RepID=UPI003ED02177
MTKWPKIFKGISILFIIFIISGCKRADEAHLNLIIQNNFPNKYINEIGYAKKILGHCSYVSASLSGSGSSPISGKSTLGKGYILFSGSLEAYLSNFRGKNTQEPLETIYAVLINAKQCAPKMDAILDVAKQENSFLIIKNDGTELFIFNTPELNNLIYIQGDM